MRPSHGSWVAGALVAAMSWGCGAAPEVPKQQVEAAEARLLSPYDHARAVVSDQLAIEISANFYDEVTRPATDPSLQTMEQATEDGDDIYRWTSRGGIQNGLTFMVGKTRFVCLKAAMLRVRGSGKGFALSAAASGNVSVSQDGAMHNCREVRIEDGLFHQR